MTLDQHDHYRLNDAAEALGLLGPRLRVAADDPDPDETAARLHGIGTSWAETDPDYLDYDAAEWHAFAHWRAVEAAGIARLVSPPSLSSVFPSLLADPHEAYWLRECRAWVEYVDARCRGHEAQVLALLADLERPSSPVDWSQP